MVDGPQGQPRLIALQGVVRDYRGSGPHLFNWWYEGREGSPLPDIPLDAMVEGYGEMDNWDRQDAVWYLGMHFTENEAVDLVAYLIEHHREFYEGLKPSTLELPITTSDVEEEIVTLPEPGEPLDPFQWVRLGDAGPAPPVPAIAWVTRWGFDTLDPGDVKGLLALREQREQRQD